MSKRRQARRAAVQLLYQAEIWGGPALPLEDVNSCLESWERDSSPDDGMRTFVIEAVYGVSERVDELDGMIADTPRPDHRPYARSTRTFFGSPCASCSIARTSRGRCPSTRRLNWQALLDARMCEFRERCCRPQADAIG